MLDNFSFWKSRAPRSCDLDVNVPRQKCFCQVIGTRANRYDCDAHQPATLAYHVILACAVRRAQPANHSVEKFSMSISQLMIQWRIAGWTEVKAHTRACPHYLLIRNSEIRLLSPNWVSSLPYKRKRAYAKWRITIVTLAFVLLLIKRKMKKTEFVPDRPILSGRIGIATHSTVVFAFSYVVRTAFIQITGNFAIQFLIVQLITFDYMIYLHLFSTVDIVRFAWHAQRAAQNRSVIAWNSQK